MTIHAQINVAEFTKMAKHLVKNVHWGLVLALTRTVGEAKKNATIDIHRVFKIRNHWVPGSIKTTSAQKGDAHPTAVVGTIQPFLKEHEKGGKRHAENVNKAESIPEYARRSSGMMTKPSSWPRALLGRNRSQHGARFDHFPPWSGPKTKTTQGPFYKQTKRGASKGRLKGSRARGGDRYFYLTVSGRGGPLKLLLQRMSKKGRAKNRVWYVIADGGRVVLRPNQFWADQVPAITRLFTKHLHKELSQALNHGRGGRL